MLFRPGCDHCESHNILRSIGWVHTPASLDKEDGFIPDGLDGKPTLGLHATANLDEKRICKCVEPAIEIRRNVDCLARNWLPPNSPHKLRDSFIKSLVKRPNHICP